MLGIAVEAHTACPSCAARVHINALVDRLTCRACDAVVEIPLEHWQSILGQTLSSEVPSLGDLQGRRSQFLTGNREYVALRGRQDPHFRDSHSPIDMHAAQAAAERGFVVNPATGRLASVRRVPTTYQEAWPQVTLVVEEELSALFAVGAQPAELQAARPGKRLEVRCSGCGGDLPLVQGQRLVGCSYCDAVSFLQDELYRRLNPDARARRFYLWTTLEPGPETKATELIHPYQDDALMPPAAPVPDRNETIWISTTMSRRCDHCAEPQPLAALVPEQACSQCGELNHLEPEFWARVMHKLAEAEVRFSSPGETHHLVSVSLIEAQLCQEAPKVPGEQQPLAMDRVEQAVPDGKLVGPTGQSLTVRRVPPACSAYLPGIEFLVGEAEELLAAAEPGVPGWRPSASAGSQVFTCPGCGGDLTVDGTQRIVVCPYCESPAGLPDELWVRLHPPRTEHKWFFTHDPRLPMFSWEDRTIDAAIDAEGNLYLLCEHTNYPCQLLVSLDPSLRRRWLVQDPLALEGTSCWKGRVAIAAPGVLALWREEQRDAVPVRRLRCEDGRPLDEPTAEVAGLDQLVVDADGSYVVVADEGKSKVLRRLAPDGSPRRLWDSDKRSGGGIRGLLRRFAGGSSEPRLRNAGDRPERVDEHHLLLACAGDAGIFIYDGELLFGFARDGGRKFKVEAPLEPVHRGLIGTPDGQLCLVSEKPGGLHRISTEDGSMTQLIPSRSEGGAWGKEELAVFGPDGGFYALGYGGELRSFDPDGVLRFANWCARRADS